MDAKQNPLSDSEIQKLRDDLAESERYAWLRRLIRTGVAWTAGILTGIVVWAEAAGKIFDWVTKK